MGYPLEYIQINGFQIILTNKVLYLMHEDDEKWWVFDLIDPNLNWWRRDLIMAIFHREDAEAFCRIYTIKS